MSQMKTSMGRDEAFLKVEYVEEEKTERPGLKLCREYYEIIGASMIHEKFEKYESRIAVGLVGEGSDCFGFDDSMSMDHDWGPGFCMWVDDVTYEAIGEQLQEEYDKLPVEYKGYRRRTTRDAEGRVGVIRIREFYARTLKLQNGIPRSEEEWMNVAEEDLATATNGQIFRDDDGVFFSLRNTLLAYYPEIVYRRKLANEIIQMSQTGQYNFRRCLERGDKVTAAMYLAEYMEHTLKVLFLINRKYAPYKKWLMRSASKLGTLSEITTMLSAIANMDLGDENIQNSIETIAKLILMELKSQNLIIAINKQDPNYMEPYGHDILNSIAYLDDGDVKNVDPAKQKHTQLIDKLVALEWDSFDKAMEDDMIMGCQDNWETFAVERKCVFMTWNNSMLESYIKDFEDAQKINVNLMTEKYARMLAGTSPEEYEEIQKMLPSIDEKKMAIIEEIVKIQVEFMESFADDYPNIIAGERSIHTFEDNADNISYETYLRAELMTYSDDTLSLYGQYIVGYAKNEKNLIEEIMSNKAKLNGYKSLDEFENNKESN